MREASGAPGAAWSLPVGAADRGGSAAGTATGTLTGAVSTVGMVDGAGKPWSLAATAGAGGTGTAMRGESVCRGGILGWLGRLGLTSDAAGICASLRGDTGLSAVAAPSGLGAARAASWRFYSSLSAW